MPKDKRFTYTGVQATEMEEAQMANPPTAKPGELPFGMTLPSQAEVMHQVALAHGLPDIHGFYGYDFEEREFLKLHDAREKRIVAPQPAAPKVLNADELAELEELHGAELDAALRDGFDDPMPLDPEE
jgi:hypothetical protein